LERNNLLYRLQKQWTKPVCGFLAAFYSFMIHPKMNERLPLDEIVPPFDHLLISRFAKKYLAFLSGNLRLGKK